MTRNEVVDKVADLLKGLDNWNLHYEPDRYGKNEFFLSATHKDKNIGLTLWIEVTDHGSYFSHIASGFLQVLTRGIDESRLYLEAQEALKLTKVFNCAYKTLNNLEESTFLKAFESCLTTE